MAEARRKVGDRVCLMGNVRPAETLLGRDARDVRAEAERCLATAATARAGSSWPAAARCPSRRRRRTSTPSSPPPGDGNGDDARESSWRVLRGEAADRPAVLCPGGMMSMAVTEVMEAAGAPWPRGALGRRRHARLALAMQEATGFDNVAMPFCMTVEAEAYGADVNLGGLESQPRIRGAVLPPDGSGGLRRPDLDSGRSAVLCAALSRSERRRARPSAPSQGRAGAVPRCRREEEPRRGARLRLQAAQVHVRAVGLRLDGHAERHGDVVKAGGLLHGQRPGGAWRPGPCAPRGQAPRPQAMTSTTAMLIMPPGQTTAGRSGACPRRESLDDRLGVSSSFPRPAAMRRRRSRAGSRWAPRSRWRG